MLLVLRRDVPYKELERRSGTVYRFGQSTRAIISSLGFDEDPGVLILSNFSSVRITIFGIFQ